MKRFALPIVFAIACLVTFNGCQPIFNESGDSWITYEVRDGLSYNEAWMVAVDAILTSGYHFETLSKDDGYIKSEWKHEVVETQGVEVRTRISIKFTYGRRTVRMKVDEEYLVGFKEPGVDVPRVADLKAEMRDRLL
jgi:hypothetical protein